MRDEALAAALARLPGWQQEERSIRKVYVFADYREVRKFVNRVADLAEEADHHPDLLMGYRRVVVTLSSHDRGRVTRRDLDLAARIDAPGGHAPPGPPN